MEASSCLGLLFQYEVFILFSVSLWKENKSINNFCVYILWHVFGSESTTTSTLNSFIHVSDISCFCTIYYIRSYLLQYWVPPYKWMFYCFSFLQQPMIVLMIDWKHFNNKKIYFSACNLPSMITEHSNYLQYTIEYSTNQYDPEYKLC